jgi:hypothetical protein
MRAHVDTFARRGVPGATDLDRRGTHLLTTQ